MIALLALPVAASLPTLDDARALHRAGRLDEALEAYLSVAESQTDTDPVAAGAARNNACLILVDHGQYRQAGDECRAALDLRRRAADDRGMARTLNNLGMVYELEGRFAEAERTYREALAINVERDDLASQVLNYANLGVLASTIGQYGRALELHRRAAEIAAAHPDQPWAQEELNIARINQGVVLEKAGAYRQALESYREVLTGEINESTRATLQLNLGVVYRNLGDPSSALVELRSAARKFADLRDVERLARAKLDLGIVYDLSLKSPAEAEPAYREALAVAQESGNRPLELEILFYLGQMMLGEGRLDEAQATLENGLAVAEASESFEGRWSSLAGLGMVALARGNYDEALARLEPALEMIEATRSDLPFEALRTSYFGERRSVYEATVDVLAALEAERPGQGLAGRSWEIVQRAKQRALLDALGGLGRTGEPLDADTIRSRARLGAILEYFATGRSLYRWSLREDEIALTDLGPAGPILADADQVHRELAAGHAPPQNLLDRLSRSLLAGDESGLDVRDVLFVATDRGLEYLPFELLSVPGTSSPLVDSVAVSYLPSASLLGTAASPPPAGLSFAGIGAPSLTASSGLPTLLKMKMSLFDLEPLPGAARELSAAATALPGESVVRVGAEATEAAFRELAARGAQILHVGSHAIVDETGARSAAIVLTPDGADDGLLTPREIAATPLRVGLTVLAACRTALGAGGEGGALATLTGSILAAGSPAVVATLWEVGDEATAAFMEQFYFDLGRGLDPAEALRATKNRFRAGAGNDHPHLWAAYVLVGNAVPLAIESPPRRWLWSLILLGLAVALWALRIHDRSRRKAMRGSA